MITFFKIYILYFVLHSLNCLQYTVSDEYGIGRTFDGIGGISGGGATSKLLVNYPKQQQEEILDLLFKPGFAASLDILKVEIGGDGESTDGTESSHMHYKGVPNYKHGYEWWLMTEAKKRNPAIKLYALPWAFPGWLGSGPDNNPYGDPQQLADYILSWMEGARDKYNCSIDYIGIWNERPYDIKYVTILRDTLDQNKFQETQIVAADGGWEIAKDLLINPDLNRAVSIIGTHYQGTVTTVESLLTEKPLWSSEDYSTFNNDVGTGCWARLLNQNYVKGFMTSTISWNLLASYYKDLPFGRDGLMTAVEPWSGHYVISNTIWATAHTTHFTEIGWSYLKHGYGTGFLTNGGSYVSLTCPCRKHLTIIVETMSHNHSICIRPALPEYNVTKQNATFTLQGSMVNITTLNAWYTKLTFSSTNDTIFKRIAPIKVINGKFTVELEVDAIYTFTTLEKKSWKIKNDIPESRPFPLPYKDSFESYEEGQEAFNFVPQTGVWEIKKSKDSKHSYINSQVLTQPPVSWCEAEKNAPPINIGGNYQWINITISIDVMIPSVDGSPSVFIATRVDKGGCDVAKTNGVFWKINFKNSTFILTSELEEINIITGGKLKLNYDTWYTLTLQTQGKRGTCLINGKLLTSFHIPGNLSHSNGFVAYGTGDYSRVDFDNILIDKPKRPRLYSFTYV